jgi:CheY-like chemotaxis protein
MGGDLIVESVHGTGATFVALIPIPDRAAVREAYGRTRSRPTRRVDSARRNVLIVDDDERILKAYARVLGRSCNVMMASDGQEAIALLSSGSSADALVTELNLPEVDGQGLYEWLVRENPELAHKTVFVAADTSRERYRTFLRHLDNHVLSKPVSANLLLSTVVKLVPDTSTGDASPT